MDYVNDDHLRVDGDKNMRLLAFAFTIVFLWTGPKCSRACLRVGVSRIDMSQCDLTGFVDKRMLHPSRIYLSWMVTKASTQRKDRISESSQTE